MQNDLVYREWREDVDLSLGIVQIFTFISFFSSCWQKKNIKGNGKWKSSSHSFLLRLTREAVSPIYCYPTPECKYWKNRVRIARTQRMRQLKWIELGTHLRDGCSNAVDVSVWWRWYRKILVTCDYWYCMHSRRGARNNGNDVAANDNGVSFDKWRCAAFPSPFLHPVGNIVIFSFSGDINCNFCI